MYGREYDFEKRSREDDYYGIEDFEFFPDSEEKESDLIEEAAVSNEVEGKISYDNNPVFFVAPHGLEEVEPGEADKERGTWTHPDSGVEYKYDKDADYWYNPNSEVTIYAPKHIAVITLTEHQEVPGFWQTIGNFFRSVENQMKGNSKWSFGIEFKTRDGKWNGNTNSIAEKDALVWTVYWDDIEDFTTALKALDKELPKEFRDSPNYSGPGTFLDEAKKYVGPPTESTYKPNKQQDGKNWDSKENRSEEPVLNKTTSKDITVKVWRYTGLYQESKGATSEGPFDNVNELKKAYPNARWNEDKGYWEAGELPK